jgi:hypothetical protein
VVHTQINLFNIASEATSFNNNHQKWWAYEKTQLQVQIEASVVSQSNCTAHHFSNAIRFPNHLDFRHLLLLYEQNQRQNFDTEELGRRARDAFT